MTPTEAIARVLAEPGDFVVTDGYYDGGPSTVSLTDILAAHRAAVLEEAELVAQRVLNAAQVRDLPAIHHSETKAVSTALAIRNGIRALAQQETPDAER